jgi:hypothetical protein
MVEPGLALTYPDRAGALDSAGGSAR